MKSIQKISILFFLITLSSTVFGQSKRLRYANNLYDNMTYFDASMAYEDVLERGIDSVTVAKKIADSYSKTNNVVKANDWYDFLSRKELLSKEETLEHAKLKTTIGNYENAKTIVENYQSKYGKDSESDAILESCTNYKQLQEDKGRFLLQKTFINTPASEISVSYIDDTKVLVSSSKKSSIAVNRIQGWTGGHYYNLYLSEIDSTGNIQKMKFLKKEANSKYNDGPACYDKINQYVYFTRDNYTKRKKKTDNQGVMRLKIYRGKLTPKGITAVEELAFNSDQFSCGHPSISADGKTLYFTSDKPGGFGGTDIYKITFDENGKASEPINLGEKVNTSFDELFPYIHPTEKLLFFSSGGHMGLGGQDIFVAKLNKGFEVKSIENVGVPVNTSMDDFSFINNDDQTKGYISSNRLEGAGTDDVYRYDQLIPFRSGTEIQGKVTDFITSQNLEKVTVKIVNKKGEVIDEVASSENGDFEFNLDDLEDDFTIVSSKDGYVVSEDLIKYDPKKDVYDKDVALVPFVNYYLAGNVYDNSTKQLLENVKVSISDLNSKVNFAALKTGVDGKFNSAEIDRKVGDSVAYNVVLSKEGYVSKTYLVKEKLANNPEIYLSGLIDVMLTPVEKGIDVGVASNLNPIYFDLNSSYLRAESKPELDKIVLFLNQNPKVSIELGAHTDCRADDKYNLWLSKRRAKNSADYIKSRISNPRRVTSQGYGETRPINVCNCEDPKDACTEEQHQLNRRTEFIIVQSK